MRKTAQTVAAGRISRKSVPALVKGGAFGSRPGGREVHGTQSGDPAAPRFRKLNNADAGPKNG